MLEPCIRHTCDAQAGRDGLMSCNVLAQAVVLTMSLGAVGFGSYASLTALQQQAQAASLAG